MNKDEDNKKLLEAQISNLEFQIAEYREIVKELTEKLKEYDSRYGKVFKKGNENDR